MCIHIIGYIWNCWLSFARPYPYIFTGVCTFIRVYESVCVCVSFSRATMNILNVANSIPLKCLCLCMCMCVYMCSRVRERAHEFNWTKKFRCFLAFGMCVYIHMRDYSMCARGYSQNIVGYFSTSSFPFYSIFSGVFFHYYIWYLCSFFQVWVSCKCFCLILYDKLWDH